MIYNKLVKPTDDWQLERLNDVIARKIRHDVSMGAELLNGGFGVDVCAPQAPTTKRPRRSGIWKNVLFGANVYVSPITEYNAA
jgi:hypothetical protein